MKYIDNDSFSNKKNFQGPGYILCPMTTVTTSHDAVEMMVASSLSFSGIKEEDDKDPTTSSIEMTDLCDSVHIDPSCSTISTCDFDMASFLVHHNTNEQISSTMKSKEIIVPLICECMIVIGCPSSCTYLTSTKFEEMV
jgi:hypothetical protein